MLFRKKKNRKIPLLSGPSNEQIIAEMEPWTLACAVGAENGSTGSALGYDFWLRMSRKNWMPKVMTRLPGVSESDIEDAVRAFVADYSHIPYDAVLAQEDRKRGRTPSVVLGPGDSMTIEIPLSNN